MVRYLKNMKNSIEYAKLLDEQDNLKHLRSLFHFPKHDSKKVHISAATL